MTEQRVIAALMDILEREQVLLKSGRAAEVAELIGEKMIALQNFEYFLQTGGLRTVAPETRRGIERIIQTAEENAAHMDAVRIGVRHALTRLESLHTGAQVGSYGRGGIQLSFSNATGSFSRKA